jgi:hypothetical protein
LDLLSIRAVDSLSSTGCTTLITIGQRISHRDLIGSFLHRPSGLNASLRRNPIPSENPAMISAQRALVAR